MPIVSNWISKYKVCAVESVEDVPEGKDSSSTSSGSGGGSGAFKKPLKICKVNIGSVNKPKIITVVTEAPNVEIGQRLVVAPIGSTVLNPDGDVKGEVVKKTKIGGINNEGLFCDERMLGWLDILSIDTANDAGLTTVRDTIGKAVEIENIVATIGESPPAFKPRPLSHTDPDLSTLPKSNVEGLFAKKLTKEEKKKISEEKKKARKAAKEAKKKQQQADATEDGPNGKTATAAHDEIP